MEFRRANKDFSKVFRMLLRIHRPHKSISELSETYLPKTQLSLDYIVITYKMFAPSWNWENPRYS